MKLPALLLLSLILFAGTGCETVNEGGRTVGRATGEVFNTVGSVTEGGAEAVQGKIKDEENPYGR